jgi:WD40 repeat protein
MPNTVSPAASACLKWRRSRPVYSRWFAAGLLFVMTSLAQSAEPVLEIGEQKRRATAMAYSPDGKILAVAVESFELKLLDAATGKLIRDLPGNSMSSNRVCWAPDGRTMYGIDGNNWLEWDVSTGAKKRTVPCEMTRTAPRCFALSPDGKVIAAGGSSAPVKLWDTATGKALGEYEPHPNYRINSLAFSRDGRSMVTTSGDDKAQITVVATGAPGPAFACERDTLWAEFSPDGKTVFVADENYLLHQYDVASGKDQPAPKLRSPATQLAVSSDGKLVACAGTAQVRIWSRADNAWRQLNIANTATEVTAVAFSPDGKRIATGGTNRGILIWNVSEIPVAK